jgi:signal transduction histidine kinase
MEYEKTDKTHGSESASHRIAVIRDTLLHQILWIAYVGGMIGVIISFARAGYSGFQWIYVFDVFAVILITAIVLFQKYISYGVRLGTIIIFSFVGSIVSFGSFGLLGYGVLFLMCAGIMAAAFTDRHLYIYIIASGTLVILVYAFLFSTSRLTPSFDPMAYIRNPISWANLTGGFIIITLILVMITSGLIQNLLAFATQSVKNIAEISYLNATLEKKVSDRTKELEQSNRDKDRVLGIVAHDINNKISGILGYLDMVKEMYRTLSESDRLLYIKKALDTCVLSKDIVQDILEFSRIKSETALLITEPVDIGFFTKSTIEGHNPKAIEKQLRLTIASEPEHIFCAINRSKFSRVIDNLISNAIKFTPSGGSISISISVIGNAALWKITDTGIGIPDSLKPYIFEPFTSSRRIGTAQETTTGLGLSISKNIVEKHSGKLWVESIENQGSTFYLEIPLTGNSDKSASNPAGNPSIQA